MLLRGTLFLAKKAVAFPTFSDDDACRFAKDDVVDDENDDRRLPFCVDISSFFFFQKAEKFGWRFYLRGSSSFACNYFIFLNDPLEAGKLGDLNCRKILTVDSTR